MKKPFKLLALAMLLSGFAFTSCGDDEEDEPQNNTPSNQTPTNQNNNSDQQQGGNNTENQGSENTENQGGENTENQGGNNTENQGNENTENQGSENTENQGGENTENQGSTEPVEAYLPASFMNENTFRTVFFWFNSTSQSQSKDIFLTTDGKGDDAFVITINNNGEKKIVSTGQYKVEVMVDNPYLEMTNSTGETKKYDIKLDGDKMVVEIDGTTYALVQDKDKMPKPSK